MRLVVVTGVSGAGKSTALRALEDLGFYAVDNLPLPLVPQLIDLLASRPDIDRIALGIDARSGNFLAGMQSIFADLRKRGLTVEVLFLEASDDILLRRFSETRRRHPLSDTDIRAGITAERQTLTALRQAASAVVDTGTLNVHVLRGLIQERYGSGEGELAVTLLSFGFKHGIPSEADIVLDVRFLPNPFFIPELKPYPGTDPRVASFVLGQPDAKAFLDRLAELSAFLLPRYRAEGKSYLTIAIGCTGGKHRSVALAGALAERLSSGGQPVRLWHRDVDKE
jgi:UPF0042 nucleotide-binding protein